VLMLLNRTPIMIVMCKLRLTQNENLFVTKSQHILVMVMFSLGCYLEDYRARVGTWLQGLLGVLTEAEAAMGRKLVI
jgi:hypothetical protein